MQHTKIAGGLLVLLTACAAPSPGDEPAETTRASQQAIIDGKPSSFESAVLLAKTISGSKRFQHWCTGSLVAKRLVVTARHCVSTFDENDGSITSTYKPSEIVVFPGADAPTRLGGGTAPAAIGSSFVTVRDDNAFPDIVFVVLDRAIEGVPIARVRLDRAVEQGEVLTAIGYGLTESGELSTVRRERVGVRVKAIGPFEGSPVVSEGGEFMVGEGTCFGDSGGPTISNLTGAIVGITSRGGNGKVSTADNPQAPCVGKDVQDFHTAVPGIKAVALKAFAAAGATPLREADTSAPPTGTDDSAPSTSSSDGDDGDAPTSRPIPPPSRAGDRQVQTSAGCTATPLRRGRSGAEDLSAFAFVGLAIAVLRRGRSKANAR